MMIRYRVKIFFSVLVIVVNDVIMVGEYGG